MIRTLVYFHGRVDNIQLGRNQGFVVVRRPRRVAEDRDLRGMNAVAILCLLLPLVVALMERAQVVDLARVIEIVLDHSHDEDPAGLSQLAPVRPAWA